MILSSLMRHLHSSARQTKCILISGNNPPHRGVPNFQILQILLLMSPAHADQPWQIVQQLRPAVGILHGAFQLAALLLRCQMRVRGVAIFGGFLSQPTLHVARGARRAVTAVGLVGALVLEAGELFFLALEFRVLKVVLLLHLLIPRLHGGIGLLHRSGPLLQLTQLRPRVVPPLFHRLAIVPSESQPFLGELLGAVRVLLLLPEGGMDVVEFVVDTGSVVAHG
mmetsp:Transcript_29350/g.70853  ORF Transcript_29350/g.70853 Transcript_29350/m.70853 type:complete len:224 (+) Transcript_29350:87-758(+)